MDKEAVLKCQDEDLRSLGLKEYIAITSRWHS